MLSTMQFLLALFSIFAFQSWVDAQMTAIIPPASNTTLATILRTTQSTQSTQSSEVQPSLIAPNIPLLSSANNSNMHSPSGVATPNGRPIIKYMAFGDSFSVGIGAGNLVSTDQPACDRTDGSYAYQLYNDEEVFVKPTPFFPPSINSKFEFNACSGAVTNDILNLQMQTAPAPYHPYILKAYLYTLTAGGNDMGFDQIVKVCVYGLVTAFSGKCNSLLDAIDGYLAPGSAFQKNLAALYDNLQNQASRYATVVILPYITFYNDQVSRGFGCWVSQAVHQRMNQQVTNVNTALRATADAHEFQFLDETSLQAAFNGHRFCDSGIKWIQDSIFESLSPQAQARFDTNGTLSPADQDIIANGTNNLINTGLFHPTKEGHTAYYQLAKALLNPVANVVSNTEAMT